MGNYFDYSLPETIDLTPGARALGDALTQVATRRQRQQQFTQELEFKREQEQRRYDQQAKQYGYQNRIEDRKERMSALEFNQRQVDRRATKSERIRAALANGDTNLAQQLANEHVEFDPLTGQETGRGKLTPGKMRDVGPEPQMPALPEQPEGFGPAPPPEIMARRRGLSRPEPEQNALIGPIPSKEEAEAAEIQKFFQQPGGNMSDLPLTLETAEFDRAADLAQRERFAKNAGQFDQAAQQMTDEEQARLDAQGRPEVQEDFDRTMEARANFPAQLAGYQSDKADAERGRHFSLAFGPNDPGQDIDPMQQRYAGREAAARDFLAPLQSLNLSDSDRAAAQSIHAGILSGNIDPSKAGAMFQRERLQASTQVFKGSEGDKDRKTRIEVAKINSRKPGLVLQERRFQASQDKDIRKETRKDISDWLKAAGLENAPKQKSLMDQSIRQLQGNPREQQAALVGMARATQGDNRFSDTDYKVFVQNGGVGALDSADNTVQKLIDGGFGAESIAVASQMAKALRAVYDNRLREAATDGYQEFVENEIYDPQVAESVLEQRLGKDYYVRKSSRGGARGGPPEVDAARKRGRSGSSTTIKATNLDEAME